MSFNDDDALNDEQLNDIMSLGQHLIFDILDKKPFDVVKAQVDAGAPLWFQDDDGTSALHAAAYVENEQLVRYLIENGAIWNSGTTPQHSRLISYLQIEQSTCCTIAQAISRCL